MISHLHSVCRGTTLTVGKTLPCLHTLLAPIGGAAGCLDPPLHARRSGLRFCGTIPMFSLSPVFMGGQSSICLPLSDSKEVFYHDSCQCSIPRSLLCCSHPNQNCSPPSTIATVISWLLPLPSHTSTEEFHCGKQILSLPLCKLWPFSH